MTSRHSADMCGEDPQPGCDRQRTPSLRAALLWGVSANGFERPPLVLGRVCCASPQAPFHSRAGPLACKAPRASRRAPHDPRPERRAPCALHAPTPDTSRHRAGPAAILAGRGSTPRQSGHPRDECGQASPSRFLAADGEAPSVRPTGIPGARGIPKRSRGPWLRRTPLRGTGACRVAGRRRQHESRGPEDGVARAWLRSLRSPDDRGPGW